MRATVNRRVDDLQEALRHHAEAAGKAPLVPELEGERARVVKDLHDAIEELEELRTEVLELRSALSEEQGDRPPWALDCSRDAQAIVRALLRVCVRLREVADVAGTGADHLHGIERTLDSDLLNAGRRSSELGAAGVAPLARVRRGARSPSRDAASPGDAGRPRARRHAA